MKNHAPRHAEAETVDTPPSNVLPSRKTPRDAVAVHLRRKMRRGQMSQHERMLDPCQEADRRVLIKL